MRAQMHACEFEYDSMRECACFCVFVCVRVYVAVGWVSECVSVRVMSPFAQDVVVPVQTRNAGGLQQEEKRSLRLEVGRGWANGTTVKFAKRPQDVSGNIVMKLQQVSPEPS